MSTIADSTYQVLLDHPTDVITEGWLPNLICRWACGCGWRSEPVKPTDQPAAQAAWRLAQRHIADQVEAALAAADCHAAGVGEPGGAA